MRDSFLKYWRGVLLSGVGAAATIWLTLTGQLNLYIHPRYFVFTAVMAGITVVAVVVALLLPRQRDHAHEDEPEDEPARPRRFQSLRARLAVAVSVVAIAVTVVGLLAIPPRALSPQLAASRGADPTTVAAQSASIKLASADASTFTVKDWAVLLAQGASEDYITAASPSVNGFIIAGDDGSFTLARYLITCCAVDAQPIGVTIASPDWKSKYQDGEWVQVAGRFVPDSSAASGWAIQPSTITAIDAPSDPYVY